MRTIATSFKPIFLPIFFCRLIKSCTFAIEFSASTRHCAL